MTIFDMDKAQIILGYLLNQECKIVVSILMLSEDFALLDNLMLFHLLDGTVFSFQSRGKSI